MVKLKFGGNMSKYIELKTEIPHPETKSIIDELDKYEPHSMHHNLPIVWNSARNYNVWDKWGNKFLDFSSGIFVTNIGHSRNYKAVITQAENSLLYTYTFPNEIRLQLAKKLIEITPKFYEKVFFLSSGSEAIDCAVKLIRLYTKKKVIVSIADAMHGKTQTGEQLKGNFKWADLSGNIFHLPFPKESFTIMDILPYMPVEKVGGFVIESYRGWDAKFYPIKFIKDLCKLARKNNILVCFDEIQGGFGRTGKLFAYQHYGITPDLIVVGKGLGNGIPISAVLGRKEIIDIANDLSSTYSANPISCASALFTLNTLIDEKLVRESNLKGINLLIYLNRLARKYKKYIKEINSKGLLGAIVFNNEDFATRVCYNAMKKGLILVQTGCKSIKIAPPLTIPIEALNLGIKIIDKSIKEVIDGRTSH